MILIEALLVSKYNPLIVDDEVNKEIKIAILLVIAEQVCAKLRLSHEKEGKVRRERSQNLMGMGEKRFVRWGVGPEQKLRKHRGQQCPVFY